MMEANHVLSIKVPATHTDLFQPLDISVNKPAKAFISGKYQQWYADRVADQLTRGIIAQNVKVDIRLSVVKPLHAQWIVDLYYHMQKRSSKEMIRKGFKAALVREAFDQAEALTQVAENPFLDVELDIVDDDV
mgnify:CR=1 FL=1